MARTRKKPVPAPAGEGVEVIDAPVQVIARAAAIDVAKGSGMVCTRLPSETRAGRRTQRVQEGDRDVRRRGGADGSPGEPGHRAAGAGEYQRLLADLVLPG